MHFFSFFVVFVFLHLIENIFFVKQILSRTHEGFVFDWAHSLANCLKMMVKDCVININEKPISKDAFAKRARVVFNPAVSVLEVIMSY